MRGAIRTNDNNFDDYDDWSDPDTWPIFINQVIEDEIDGAIDLDVEMEIHWTVKDQLVSNQKGQTGFFEDNMQTFYRVYFNNTALRFSVDTATITVKSGSNAYAPFWLLLFFVVVCAFVLN